MTARAVLLVAVAVGTACCNREPSRLDLQPLAEGEWIVVDVGDDGAVLQRIRDKQPRRNYDSNSAVPEFALLGDTLTPSPVDTFSRDAGGTNLVFAHVRGRDVITSLDGQRTLYRSPADPQLFAFEHVDAIWVLKAPGELHKLTLDYDRDSLRTRQREGAVILYWSANPVWSGDGKFIAFNSNRESVRGGGAGQSLWIIDAYTGIQGPVYDTAGESVHTEGAFGEDFVFVSDKRPGVWAVHPRTRSVRLLGQGYVAAAHARGEGLLLNNNGELTLLTKKGARKLLAPPSGHVWSTQAAIAPSGDRVAAYSTDQTGVYMLHVLGAGEIAPIKLPALPAHGPAWSDDRTIIVSLQERGTIVTYRAIFR